MTSYLGNVDYITASAEIAREAGALLQQHFAGRVTIEYKGEFDIVTAADRASERLVVGRLRTRFPSHAIVSEEGGGVKKDSDYTWYVDPLDGTTNFAHRQPTFAVSLGLFHRGEPAVGIVFDPLRDELFSAERGSGAYLNHRRINVSETSSLAEGLFGTGFASAKRHKKVNVHFFHQISMLTHGVRRSGSAALDLCSVACGRLEGFWEFGLKPWDTAAGLLMVREAGGRYTDMRGGTHALGGDHLAASNGRVHDEWIELFSDVFAGRYRAPLPPVTD